VGQSTEQTTLSAHHVHGGDADISFVSARRWITMTTLMDERRGSDVMELLRQGVPLTLLLDLADPSGPRSDELYLLEGSAA
jgi:hypothetical protein